MYISNNKNIKVRSLTAAEVILPVNRATSRRLLGGIRVAQVPGADGGLCVRVAAALRGHQLTTRGAVVPHSCVR